MGHRPPPPPRRRVSFFRDGQLVERSLKLSQWQHVWVLSENFPFCVSYPLCHSKHPCSFHRYDCFWFCSDCLTPWMIGSTCNLVKTKARVSWFLEWRIDRCNEKSSDGKIKMGTHFFLFGPPDHISVVSRQEKNPYDWTIFFILNSRPTNWAK